MRYIRQNRCGYKGYRCVGLKDLTPPFRYTKMVGLTGSKNQNINFYVQGELDWEKSSKYYWYKTDLPVLYKYFGLTVTWASKNIAQFDVSFPDDTKESDKWSPFDNYLNIPIKVSEPGMELTNRISFGQLTGWYDANTSKWWCTCNSGYGLCTCPRPPELNGGNPYDPSFLSYIKQLNIYLPFAAAAETYEWYNVWQDYICFNSNTNTNPEEQTSGTEYALLPSPVEPLIQGIDETSVVVTKPVSPEDPEEPDIPQTPADPIEVVPNPQSTIIDISLLQQWNTAVEENLNKLIETTNNIGLDIINNIKPAITILNNKIQCVLSLFDGIGAASTANYEDFAISLQSGSALQLKNSSDNWPALPMFKIASGVVNINGFTILVQGISNIVPPATIYLCGNRVNNGTNLVFSILTDTNINTVDSSRIVWSLGGIKKVEVETGELSCRFWQCYQENSKISIDIVDGIGTGVIYRLTSDSVALPYTTLPTVLCPREPEENNGNVNSITRNNMTAVSYK